MPSASGRWDLNNFASTYTFQPSKSLRADDWSIIHGTYSKSSDRNFFVVLFFFCYFVPLHQINGLWRKKNVYTAFLLDPFNLFDFWTYLAYLALAQRKIIRLDHFTFLNVNHNPSPAIFLLLLMWSYLKPCCSAKPYITEGERVQPMAPIRKWWFFPPYPSISC